MNPSRLVILIFVVLFSSASVKANDTLKIHKITSKVYAIVGSMDNRTAENLGNNATFGFIITKNGVVLIDSGATTKGAMRLHESIKKITDKPIVMVINTGGQDHRWLGNSYFKQLGARIISSANAVKDQQARTQDQLFMLGNLVGIDGLAGTRAVYADSSFDTVMDITLGDTEFKIQHAGQAHTPGDSFVWLPKDKIMFTGDIVYTERMLGVGQQSNSKSWISVFENMAAYQPTHIIPGHGAPTNLQTAKKDSYDYLVFLRQSVKDLMDKDGDISEIGKIDQKQYNYLKNYNSLAGRNAQKVYAELEWE